MTENTAFFFFTDIRQL